MKVIKNNDIVVMILLLHKEEKMKIQYKDKTLDIERGSKIYDIFKD